MFMLEITSIKDPLFQVLKSCRSKQGQEESSLVLLEDGMILEALDFAPELLNEIFVQDKLWWQKETKSRNYRSKALYHLKMGYVKKLYPQGKTPKAIALCSSPVRDLDTSFDFQKILVLEDVQDAGNIGCLIRSAEGLAVEGIIVVSQNKTHLFSRNAIRSSMGSFFRMPLAQTDLASFSKYVKELNLSLIGTSPRGKSQLHDFLLPKGACALVLGNETEGMSQEMEALCEHTLSLPMKGKIESLNVAVCAGIFLHHLFYRK